MTFDGPSTAVSLQTRGFALAIAECTTPNSRQEVPSQVCLKDSPARGVAFGVTS